MLLKVSGSATQFLWSLLFNTLTSINSMQVFILKSPISFSILSPFRVMMLDFVIHNKVKHFHMFK